MLAPKSWGAYEDAKDGKSAGALFTAVLNGQNVKGFISAKATDQVTTVMVIYGRADTPAAEWSKLTAKAPAPAPAAAAPAGQTAGGVAGRPRSDRNRRRVGHGLARRRHRGRSPDDLHLLR